MVKFKCGAYDSLTDSYCDMIATTSFTLAAVNEDKYVCPEFTLRYRSCGDPIHQRQIFDKLCQVDYDSVFNSGTISYM